MLDQFPPGAAGLGVPPSPDPRTLSGTRVCISRLGRGRGRGGPGAVSQRGGGAEAGAGAHSVQELYLAGPGAVEGRTEEGCRGERLKDHKRSARFRKPETPPVRPGAPGRDDFLALAERARSVGPMARIPRCDFLGLPGICYLLSSLLAGLLLPRAIAFNLDVMGAIRKEGEPGSLFGFSVALHRQLQPRPQSW